MKPSPSSQIGEVEPSDLEPLALSQERFWLLQRILPQEPNLAGVALHLRGGLDREALQGALNDWVALQPAARTSYLLVNGQGRARVADPPRASCIRWWSTPTARCWHNWVTRICGRPLRMRSAGRSGLSPVPRGSI